MAEQDTAAEELIVRSEQDAFALLERAVKNEIGDHPIRLKFDKWPLVEIRLDGPGYESTITPDMASALVELQSAINRSYARAVHASDSSRSLTLGERQRLQFKAKVENGSSLITVDLGSFAENVAVEMVSRMQPEILVGTVVGLAIAGGSLLAYKAYLRAHSEDKKVSEATRQAIALSQEETRRLEIFARATAAYPQLQLAARDFDDARQEIVRGTADANSLSVNSLSIDQESARIIAAAKRSEAREVQLNGNYEILETNWRKDSEISLRVINAETGQEFVASMPNDALNDEQTDLLQAAEWNRTKVYLSINAHELRGTITKARIISVTVQPPAESART